MFLLGPRRMHRKFAGFLQLALLDFELGQPGEIAAGRLMAWTQHPRIDLQGASHERLGAGVIAAVFEEQSLIAERKRSRRMIGPERFLPDLEASFAERLRFFTLAHVAIDHR